MQIREGHLIPGFVEMVKKMKAPVVFELGTKQSIPGRSTMHKEWVPQASAFIGIDFEEGGDVDYVADAQHLSRDLMKYPHRECDVFISCSTFEHIQNPFLAAEEICKVVRPGGLIMVQTHQTFPLHAYPYDYWRYTVDSLRHLFTRPGVEILDAAYQFPANIMSAKEPNAKDFPAYLNVCLVARKKANVEQMDLGLLERVIDGLGSEEISSRLRSDIGELCFGMGLHDHARRLFEKALSADPRNCSALNNLGVVSFQLGDFESARKLFLEALKADPGNREAAANLAALPGSAGGPGAGTDR